MAKRRVVVTGLGIVSPLGSTIASAWEGICNGRSGIRTLTRLDTTAFPVHIGGEVTGFNAEDYMSPKDVRKYDPFVPFGVGAGLQAFRDSGLEVTEANCARIGIAMGAGIGGLSTIEENTAKWLEARTPRKISPFFIPGSIINAATGQASGPPDTLDLASAIRQARAASPRLIAADAAVAAAGARVGPAGALPDPTLTIGAMNYMARGLAVDPVMTMNQVTLMQMVPVNGMPGLRRSVAREDSARTAFTRDGRTLDVEREVRTRFWAVYHLDRRLVLLDRTAALVRELGSTAASMYAVGSASQSDVLRAQVAATRVTEQLAMLRLQRTRAAAALNAAIPWRDPASLPRPQGAHREPGGSGAAADVELSCNH